MTGPVPPLTDEDIAAADPEALRRHANWRGTSHQSAVLLIERAGRRYVIKSPQGRGFRRWLTARLIRREAAIYRRLEGLEGVPRCYGLTARGRLVLECVPARAFRDNPPTDRLRYFDRLLPVLKAMHARGIAHGDLKNKDNLMVGPGDTPWVIDFGIAMRWRAGFHPLNHWLFRLAKQLDYNAWIKHKYGRRPSGITAEDRAYWKRGWLERLWRPLRNAVQRLRGRSTSGSYRPQGTGPGTRDPGPDTRDKE